MTFREVLLKLREFLDTELFRFADTTITVGTLLLFGLIVVLTFWLAGLVQKTVERVLLKRAATEEGSIGAISRLLRYATLIVGLSAGIHTVGVNLNALFAAGALFAVGLGFAMQNVVANFVSGVILLSERAIKPGDIIDLGGSMVRVTDMGIRATIVRTLNDENVVIPNSVLVEQGVTNYTLEDRLYRLRVEVGVSYQSDLALVRRVLTETAEGLEWRSESRQPVVLLSNFGDSAVIYETSVWVDDPWASRRGRSDLREAIWLAFQREQITIAYPQLDVHFDPPRFEPPAGESIS